MEIYSAHQWYMVFKNTPLTATNSCITHSDLRGIFGLDHRVFFTMGPMKRSAEREFPMLILNHGSDGLESDVVHTQWRFVVTTSWIFKLSFHAVCTSGLDIPMIFSEPKGFWVSEKPVMKKNPPNAKKQAVNSKRQEKGMVESWRGEPLERKKM